MPGFDTLGVRLSRSRRRLERQRAAVNGEQPSHDGLDAAVPGEGASAIAAVSMLAPSSAQVIRFPRLSQRNED
jgi:hypothetical protein